MAYYVYSSLDATLAEGPLMIRAGVAGPDVERTLASIDHELTLVRASGLTAKELDESKRYLIGSIPRQLETNAGIAGFLLSAELHGLGADHDRHLPGSPRPRCRSTRQTRSRTGCSIRRAPSSSLPDRGSPRPPRRPSS